MKLLIYRKDGKITQITEYRDECADIDERIQAFNKDNVEKNLIVTLEAFDDNGVTAWLYNNNTLLYNDKTLKKRLFRDDLQDITSELSNLASRLRWLEDELKAMES